MDDNKIIIKLSENIKLDNISIKDNHIVLKSNIKHYSNIYIIDIDSNDNIQLRIDNEYAKYKYKPEPNQEHDDDYKSFNYKPEPEPEPYQGHADHKSYNYKEFLKNNEFPKYDFTNSKIIENSITTYNDIIISNNKNYSSILKDIYLSMSIHKIPLRATFITLGNVKGKGTYIPNLNMTIKGNNANTTIKEIINLIEINNYKINIKIKLSTGDEITLK